MARQLRATALSDQLIPRESIYKSKQRNEKHQMANSELLIRYNYDSFIPENFGPWLNFGQSPAVGEPAPDFPLWDLDKKETKLSDIWSQNDFTVVEFGSFT